MYPRSYENRVYGFETTITHGRRFIPQTNRVNVMNSQRFDINTILYYTPENVSMVANVRIQCRMCYEFITKKRLCYIHYEKGQF